MVKQILRCIIATMLFNILLPGIQAQEVALKTNFLYWSTSSPNLGVEYALNSKTSIGVTGGMNLWNFNQGEKIHKIQHWVVKPEARLWLNEVWKRHFLETHLFYGKYNIGGVYLPQWMFSDLKNNRYEGYGLGMGFTYGYQWQLSAHWHIEATLGIGYSYLNYKRYDCFKCGEYFGKEHTHYFGPTQLGLSAVYLF